jgi:hypothetical protein
MGIETVIPVLIYVELLAKSAIFIADDGIFVNDEMRYDLA